MTSTNRIQRLENLASTAKSLILRNIPEPRCYGLVKLRMLEVFKDDLITSASRTGIPIPDFENLDFKIASGLMGIQTGNFNKHKSPQPKEKFSQRRDHLQADRLLGISTTSSKLVATMEPS